MPIPTSRNELLNVIEGNFTKPFKDLETIPYTRCREATLEGHTKGTMMNVHNALIIGEEFGKVLPQYSRAHGFIENKSDNLQ